MNKEKEIEKLSEILSDDYCKLFDDGQGQDCSCECDNCRANRVVKAGYRKADEVRKETAKDILQGIYELCKEKKQIEFDDVFYWVMKYGVEVNE